MKEIKEGIPKKGGLGTPPSTERPVDGPPPQRPIVVDPTMVVRGDGAQVLYVVYQNPLDYPGQYVLRRWFIDKGNSRAEQFPVIVHGLLSRVREKIPGGFVRLKKQALDDPAILEVWA